MNLSSFPLSYFGYAVLNGVRARGDGEGLLLHGFGAVGLARAGPGSIWDSQRGLGITRAGVSKTWKSPLKGKEDREEIKDIFLYWGSCKKLTKKCGKTDPKCAKMQWETAPRGSEGAPCASAPCVAEPSAEPDLPINNTKLYGLLKG